MVTLPLCYLSSLVCKGTKSTSITINVRYLNVYTVVLGYRNPLKQLLVTLCTLLVLLLGQLLHYYIDQVLVPAVLLFYIQHY